MQRVIELHPRDDYEPFEIEVTMPGVLRRIVTGMTEPSTIIMADMGRPPVAEIRSIPVLAFESDPQQPKAKRSFLWLQAGVKLNYDGKLQWRDAYVDERTGTPLFLYEVFKS